MQYCNIEVLLEKSWLNICIFENYLLPLYCNQKWLATQLVEARKPAGSPPLKIHENHQPLTINPLTPYHHDSV